MNELPPHPAAEMFPLMEGPELTALIEDIRHHGQREPVVVTDGKVLDGRNRYRACLELGVKPILIQWDHVGTPESFVVSMNLHRRHLNESQRALIAARLATRTREETLIPNASHRQLPLDNRNRLTSMTARQAAGLLNVGVTSTSDAKNVLRNGLPQEIAAIEGGRLSVYTVAKRIRAGLAPDKRERALTKSRDDGHEMQVRTQRLRADIWGKLRSALEAFTEMPRPKDAAETSREFVKRFKFPMRQHLTRAQKWLHEFEEHFDA